VFRATILAIVREREPPVPAAKLTPAVNLSLVGPRADTRDMGVVGRRSARTTGTARREKEDMEDNYEKYAVAVIIVFGALMIGGLMAAGLSMDDRQAFLWALGAAFFAWISGYTVLFDKPRIYGGLIVVAAVFAIASIVALMT
jgi:hypothetical protein